MTLKSANAIEMTIFGLFFSVPVKVFVNLTNGSKTLEEGRDLSLYCDATGFPDPNVIWTTDGDNDPVHSKWLNFSNINKDKSGDYICSANNTCGKVSSNVTSIDVQCKSTSVSISNFS